MKQSHFKSEDTNPLSKFINSLSTFNNTMTPVQIIIPTKFLINFKVFKLNENGPDEKNVNDLMYSNK